VGKGLLQVRLVTMALALGVLGGCATSASKKDPAEGFNRAVFAFNEGLDTVLIRPVAKGYDMAMPLPARTGVSNFFGNIADIFIGVNNLLQGKGSQAASDEGRFLINSTVGILGFFDVASEMGMDKHNEDFGQTFGRWGAGPGAYVVLPFFGPRDVRDTGGLVLDLATDPIGYVTNIRVRNSLVGVRVINDRAALLPADKVIEEAALDKYSYLRDAYLQRRQSLVYDGNPPPDTDSE